MTNGADFSCLLCLLSTWERRIVLIFFEIILLTFPSAYSQSPPKPDTSLAEIESLYENGSYLTAELQARRMLEEKDISDSMRVQVEKYVAFSLVAQDKREAAIEHFESALKIDSTLTLDPDLTSPKILEVFDAARRRFRAELEEKRSERVLESSSIGTTHSHEGGGPTFRAIVFPGWEQSFRGNPMKGRVLLGVGAAAALSSITFDFLRRDARRSYLDASTPDLASSRYTTYDSYYKVEFYSVAAFVLVYAYSAIDAFVDLPPYVKLDYSPGRSASQLSLQVCF